MKKIIYIAVAAIAALSSCSSDEFAGSNGNNGDAKVFTATIEGDATSRSTYDASSKSAFWETTDIVSINGVKYQAQSGGAATTTFKKVTGETAADATAPYYAFFADGANTGDGSYSATGKFTLPASYNYAAGKFNMPMYAYSASSTELSFKNLCGVLAITVPTTEMSSVSSIIVTSDQQLNGAFTATEAGVLTFSGTATDDNKKITLTVAAGGTGNVYYIPVPANSSHKLKVEVSDGTTTKSMTTSSAVEIARNNIYSIEFSGKHTYIDGHEYVDLCLASGLLWATCNVGATNPQDYGNYYAWGETTAQTLSATDPKDYSWASYKWMDHTTVGVKDSWKGCQKYTFEDSQYDGCWYNSSKEYIGTTVGGVEYKNLKKLESSDDAATANFGGSWRMPTHDELSELVSGTYNGWTANYNNTNVGGYIFYKKVDGKTSFSAYSTSDTHIFLPAAGYRVDGKLENAGFGYYRSSELYSSDSNRAWGLSCGYISSMSSSFVRADSPGNRCDGLSVRAVRSNN